ncbi:MAG: tetratricopeptide repeat protein, partial [Candidatus Sulfotelmatobacter sp.]
LGMLFTALALIGLTVAQVRADSNFKLALPDHPGQLRWSAEGFRIIQSSAKPKGNEIGIRGRDETGRLTFLVFLFLIPEQAPLTSAKCRDGALQPEKKDNPTLKIIGTSEKARPGTLPVSVVTYAVRDAGGRTLYIVRGFVASGDMCGDLELYSNAPVSSEDEDVKKILASYQLGEDYIPKFNDVLLYAQVLYNARMYKAAAPVFEMALAKVGENPGPRAKTMRRVVTDQAGMSYGMSGDIAKARAIFEKASVEDPDYPMYYYNLACADAEEKNLASARNNLQKAFDRKANVIPGEKMPDPTTDDSFLPYRENKEFWAFLEGLHAKP